MFKTAGKVNSI